MIRGQVNEDTHGLSVEKKFIEVTRGLYGSKNVKISTTEENMIHHIDCFIDGVSYDVKSEKKLNRNDEESSPDVIWLEYKNVKGYTGWLFSEKLQKIAFYRNSQFYIIDRIKLMEYAKTIIEDETVYSTKQYRKFYRRFDRPHEKVTYVYFSDIEHLVEKII